MSGARTDCVVPQEDRRITGKAVSVLRSAWYRNKVEVEMGGQRGVPCTDRVVPQEGGEKRALSACCSRHKKVTAV